MLFNSHIFLFAFLPVTILGLLLIRQLGFFTLAVFWLVGASTIFYGWWNPAYLWLIYAVMLTNYGVGWLLANAPWPQVMRKALFVFGVVGNIAVLAWFKYANFITDNINAVTSLGLTLDKIILPLAISFFIFQKIAFLVDTYRRETRARDLLRYSLFVLFFPQLIAGPIVRFQEVAPQFEPRAMHNASRRWASDLSIGLMIFGVGLFKKIMIADGLATIVTPIFDGAGSGIRLDFVEAWTCALAYTLQLYFDFSGYSEMAVGLARMVGIKLPPNFWSPYKATSIIDFWRRWHITLSRFLRDYLYIPLGGNRKGPAFRYANLFITMLIGGLWHGANWTFVVWGLLHGFYLTVNHLWRNTARTIGCTAGVISPWAARVITFVFVVFAWVVFRSNSLSVAGDILYAMIGGNGVSFPKAFGSMTIAKLSALEGMIRFDGVFPNDLFAYRLRGWVLPIFTTLLAFCWLAPNTFQVMSHHKPIFNIPEISMASERPPRYLSWRPSTTWAMILIVLLTASILMMGEGVSEFLYFQF